VPSASPGPTLPRLVAARLLDPPLAALAWLLLERGVPVLVAGDPGSRAELLDALAGALPADRRADDAAGGGGGGRLVRVAGTLAAGTPAGILRAALAATTGRSGLAALIDAPDLAGVLDVLARQGLTDDEASFLGVVLIAERRPEAGDEPRVAAAHYLRPLVRDAGGHERRQRPAVLATWEPRDDRWEDFAWGIGPDLAERCRMRTGDFEAERVRRAALLAELVARGDLDADALDAAAGRLALDAPVVGD
jgi:hypothetical protein